MLSLRVLGLLGPTALLAHKGERRIDRDTLVSASVPMMALARTLTYHLTARPRGDGLEMLLEVEPLQTPVPGNLSTARWGGAVFHVDDLPGNGA